MFREVISNSEHAMTESIEHLHRDLGGIRTGKANPALLDSIRVEYFGQQVPLKQVASIAAPDARLITVQPWDRNVIGEIEKAILASDLGLNPQNVQRRDDARHLATAANDHAMDMLTRHQARHRIDAGGG